MKLDMQQTPCGNTVNLIDTEREGHVVISVRFFEEFADQLTPAQKEEIAEQMLSIGVTLINEMTQENA